MKDVQVILYFFSRNKSFYVFSSPGVRPWYVVGSSPLKPPNQINPRLAEMGSFQNFVRQPRPAFKMDAVTKNRHFLNCPLLVYYISNELIF